MPTPGRSPPDATEADGRASWLRPFQVMLGGTLIAYIALHVRAQWSALSGRELWVDWVGQQASSGRSLVWLAGFVAYCLLAFARWWSGGKPALLRLRTVMGAGAFAFVLLHAGQLVSVRSGPHRGPLEAYELLWQSAGTPMMLVAYITGLFMVCMYAALVCDDLLGDWLGLAHHRWRTGARYFLGIVTLLGWGLMLHLLGHFALGDGLVPTGDPVRRVSPRTGGQVDL